VTAAKKEKGPKLDVVLVNHLVEMGSINDATMVVTVYGENCRRLGIDPAKTKEIRDLYNKLYKACIEMDHLDCYALVFESTGFVPHGSLIQPVFDKVISTFGPLVKQGELPLFHKEILWRFIELSLEAYDKMHSFQVFFTDFREYVPFHLVPKAIAIANALGDKKTVELIQQNFLQPPKEVDHSPSGQE